MRVHYSWNDMLNCIFEINEKKRAEKNVKMISSSYFTNCLQITGNIFLRRKYNVEYSFKPKIIIENWT